MENESGPAGRPRKGSLEKISVAELLYGGAAMLVIFAIILLAGIRLSPSIAATVLFVVALGVSIWRYGRGS